MMGNDRELNEYQHRALGRSQIIPISKIICPISEKNPMDASLFRLELVNKKTCKKGSTTKDVTSTHYREGGDLESKKVLDFCKTLLLESQEKWHYGIMALCIIYLRIPYIQILFFLNVAKRTRLSVIGISRT